MKISICQDVEGLSQSFKDVVSIESNSPRFKSGYESSPGSQSNDSDSLSPNTAGGNGFTVKQTSRPDFAIGGGGTNNNYNAVTQGGFNIAAVHTCALPAQQLGMNNVSSVSFDSEMVSNNEYLQLKQQQQQQISMQMQFPQQMQAQFPLQATEQEMQAQMIMIQSQLNLLQAQQRQFGQHQVQTQETVPQKPQQQSVNYGK